MRIFHLSSWFQPKLGYSEFHLPKAQAILGHKVSVLTSDRFFPFPDYEETVGKLLGPRVVGFGSGTEEGIAVQRLRARFEIRHHMWLVGLAAALDRERPDVIHAHEAFTLPVYQCARWAWRNRVPLVIASSMENEVFREMDIGRRYYYKFHRRLATPMLRKPNVGLTAVGPGARAILSAQIGVSESSVEIVPLGADSARFTFDAGKRTAIRRRLQIEDECIVIVYAGKLIEGKDVHVLAEALAQANSKSQILLLLVGEGKADYKAKIEATLKTAGVRCVISKPVPNDELPGYFSASDLGVWPSQSSNAAIEAALVGLPLIVSDVQATKHYIAAGNGISFTRGDVAMLSKGIDQLVSNPGERQRMSELGKLQMSRSMTWSAIAVRYLEIYERLIEATRA